MLSWRSWWKRPAASRSQSTSNSISSRRSTCAAPIPTPLRRAWPAWLLRTPWLAPQSTLCSVRQLADWHGAGFAVNCWVADDPAEARALCAMGADALTSNDPARVRAVLDEVPG